MYKLDPVIWKEFASAPDNVRVFIPNPSSVTVISATLIAAVVLEFSKIAVVVFVKAIAVGA